MNFFEKMSMILIPIIGLTAIMAFFSWYVQGVNKGDLYESQRLQGQHSLKKIDTKFSNKVTNKVYKPKATQRTVPNNNFIKWESEKSVTYVPQSVKNRIYKYTKQAPSYSYPANKNEASNQLQLKYKQQEQANTRKIKKQQKMYKAKHCSYYLEKKEEIRDRMRRRYKASQYNRLEKKHKYWSKQYADNCFSGYQYPR